MADLKISPDEIRDALKGFVNSYESDKASRNEVGHVIDAGDGIAHVEGLREVGTVILGNFEGIEEGMEVQRTGEVLSVPVGDAFLGRVVDPLGNPIDGLGDIKAEARRALELQAPGVMARKSVHEPLQTGIKAIDAMIPIGRLVKKVPPSPVSRQLWKKRAHWSTQPSLRPQHLTQLVSST